MSQEKTLSPPSASSELGEAAPAGRRRRVWIAAILALVLVGGGIGGFVAWTNYREQQRIDAMVAEAAAVVTQVTNADEAQDDAVHEAAGLLAASEGKVADEATLTALGEAIEAAGLAALSSETIDANNAAKADGAVMTDAEKALTLAKRDLQSVLAANAPLAAAVAGVEESVEAKALADAKQLAADAQTALDAAIATGEQVLAATDGKVADNTVRQTLQNALDAARQAPADPGSNSSTRESWANVAVARDQARSAVESATEAVTEAWQDEQERPASETPASTSTHQPASNQTKAPQPAQTQTQTQTQTQAPEPEPAQTQAPQPEAPAPNPAPAGPPPGWDDNLDGGCDKVGNTCSW